VRFWIPAGSAKFLLEIANEYRLDVPTGTPGMFEHQLTEFEYYAIAVALREYRHAPDVAVLLEQLKYYYNQSKCDYRSGGYVV